jgi:hypothetical protein
LNTIAGWNLTTICLPVMGALPNNISILPA